MTQGFLNSLSVLSSAPTYNSHRLYEAHLRNGLFELQKLQEEDAIEAAQYGSNMPLDEFKNCQFQYGQFRSNINRMSLDFKPSYQSYKHEMESAFSNRCTEFSAPPIYSYKPDANYYMTPSRSDAMSLNLNCLQFQQQKPPLQQQLLQHRLLQQKRQIFQKQVAIESHVSRSQIPRQNSYKAVQHRQFDCNLQFINAEPENVFHLQRSERSEWHPFIPTYGYYQQPKNFLKTSYIKNHSQVTSACSIPMRCKANNIDTSETWNSLPKSINACKINKCNRFDNGGQESLYQVSTINFIIFME